MDNVKLCPVCKKDPCEKGRRYCRRCYLDKRKTFYLAKGGSKGTTRYGIGSCISCGNDIKLNHKDQKYCLSCFRHITSIGNNATNNYENAGGGGYCWKHRKMAEELLGKKLNTNQIIHHLDLNPKNNSLDNIIIISREQHGRLHAFLREMRASFEKSKDVQDENCWNTLIVQITTTWLETASVKVTKLSEIGQPAAEAPKTENCQGEGSETMHVLPKEYPSKEMI